jgi:hypothetical protein
MTEQKQPKQPTDHLPPRDERASDDERTTEESYPRDAEDHPLDRSAVSEDTAAEPEKPARHGVAKLRPGPH